jgi:hypothetical protein
MGKEKMDVHLKISNLLDENASMSIDRPIAHLDLFELRDDYAV